MLAKRVIPCLDCDLAKGPEGRVVKGRRFRQLQYAGRPVELAEQYCKAGADEIAFLDITASSERRRTMEGVVLNVSENIFVPLLVGGGIRSVQDFERMLKAGADKCSINTAAIEKPSLIRQAASIFGSQCVVVAIDAKKERSGRFACYSYGGRKKTNLDAVEWACKAEELGAGEILLTSMERDGTKEGFDLELTQAVCNAVNIPVIASGGCGSPKDMLEVFQKTDASAALAAGMFHRKEFSIGGTKQYLASKGIGVRI